LSAKASKKFILNRSRDLHALHGFVLLEEKNLQIFSLFIVNAVQILLILWFFLIWWELI